MGLSIHMLYPEA